MSLSPYSKYPDTSFWRKSVSTVELIDVDPIINFPYKINKETKVATAGSCFAQHIARYLKLNNFNYYITEPGHSVLSEEVKKVFNYGTFSARFGNLYTSRQLLQLFKRAHGQHIPKEDIWEEGNSIFIDPFRPNIQPEGFCSSLELIKDREQHFKAVRTLFETLDIFIFTLGLTECWADKAGSVFPLCPGVAGGTFDQSRYHFINLSTKDVINDLSEFVVLLKEINPNAKIILTVSPVPLIATATPNHVLTSTTYSKSVLRVAADEICQMYSNVDYFPSYEIITGSYTRGAYFSDDLRGVTEEGVQHVMRLFFKHVANKKIKRYANNKSNKENSLLKEMKRIVDVICEENLIETNNKKV